MSKDFFDKPFDEDTLIKLEMYGDYVRKWVPVFLANKKPFVNKVNIMDFFSRVGCDSNGKPGSPILAINILMEYEEYLKREDITVNVFFNDYNADYCKRLKSNIDKLEFDKENIRVEILNEQFTTAYETLKPKMKGSANLLFLDQFGIKYVTRAFFQDLIKIPHTDSLFFISSATYKRFCRDENISEIIGLNPKDVQEVPSTHIHRLVTKTYDSFIPKGFNYSVAPFSIKKGANVYGLIFGSGHPLGMEKFLEVCWDKDKRTGEANFDIEGEGINEQTPFLFEEMNTPSKIEVFQTELKEKILSGEIKNDRDIYFFMINSGFLGQHVRPVIQELKNDKIELKHPSFKCKTVLDKEREPKEIKIL